MVPIHLQKKQVIALVLSHRIYAHARTHCIIFMIYVIWLHIMHIVCTWFMTHLCYFLGSLSDQVFQCGI